MKIQIKSINWPLLAICAAVLIGGPRELKLQVGGFIALSILATWFAYFGLPAYDRWLANFRGKNQPRERISVVGVELSASPGSDTFGVIEPHTGRHFFVPVGTDGRRLSFGETGTVIASTNRFNGSWIAHSLVPPQ